MTTMSETAGHAGVRAEPRAKARNLSLDRTRTFLTLVVLLHHAVIPYTYFGHTDPTSFAGFDGIVLATDSFFMAMFFFLSGLFVWPGLGHKAPLVFLRDRLLRLGLPFAVAALTLIPLAYYAIELRHHPETTFAAFWWKTVTVGPWPSGPVWFVWVLLTFDITASLLYRISPTLLGPINRLSVKAHDDPLSFFLFLFGLTALLYIPGRVYFGPGHWFEFGPFSVQASRVLLYAAYFFIGAGIGAANFDRGLLAPTGRLARSGWGWAALTVVPYALLWGLIFIKRQILGNPLWLPVWYETAYAIFFTAFSASILFAILAWFIRFKRDGSSVLDPMQADAYGMFLVHYPIVLWIQYYLFDLSLPAIAKAAISFVLSVVLSWAVTAALRRIPGVSRVL